MNFWNGFGIALKSFFKAFEIVFSKWQIAIFLIVPLIINVSLFWGGNKVVGFLIDNVQTWLFSVTGLSDAGSMFSGYAKTVIGGIILFIFKAIFLFLFAYVGGYVVLALMAPAFAFLSEKTETIIEGKDYSFNGEKWMRDLIRGIIIVFRNLFIEIGLIILIMLAVFIPIIGPFVALFGSFFLFIVSAYFYGFSFIDYSLERRNLNISQSVKFVRSNRGFVIGNGFIFTLCLMIPLCGPTLATFVSVFSAVGASYSVVELEKYNNVNKI